MTVVLVLCLLACAAALAVGALRRGRRHPSATVAEHRRALAALAPERRRRG